MYGFGKLIHGIIDENRYRFSLNSEKNRIEVFFNEKVDISTLQGLIGQRIEVKELLFENFSGDKFEVLNFEARIIGGKIPGISVTDNIFDELLETYENNKYKSIYLLPIDNKINMTFIDTPVKYQGDGRSQYYIMYKQLGLLKQFPVPHIPICNNDTEMTFLKPTENDSFMLQSNVEINDFYDYSIGFLQGLMPIRQFMLDLTQKKLIIYFNEDSIKNRKPYDLASFYVKSDKEDTPSGSLDDMLDSINKEQSKYIDFIMKFNRGFIDYYTSLSAPLKAKLKEVLELYIDVKSNPSHTNMKLLLNYSCIESLNIFCNTNTNEKIDKILAEMEKEIGVTTSETQNEMLRRLRNGIAHYLDHSKKLNTNDLKCFEDNFNKSLEQVYCHLTNLIDRFFIKKSNA